MKKLKIEPTDKIFARCSECLTEVMLKRTEAAPHGQTPMMCPGCLRTDIRWTLGMERPYARGSMVYG